MTREEREAQPYETWTRGVFRIYIVGIDIGKRHHEASIIDGQGSLQGRSLRFANTHTGFNKLLEVIRKTAGKDEVVLA